ncbi:hypothetical protein ABIE13_000735 [Ottowia thiooxydans]|uniref:Uncharacterized protein n=1 Tax=Ottowia thiooxydans TaxID=219182 RepID=A0ABV2Q4Z6_9BURK
MSDYSPKIALSAIPAPSAEIIAKVLWKSAISFGLAPTYDVERACEPVAGQHVRWIERSIHPHLNSCAAR